MSRTTSPRRNHSNRSRSSRVYNSSNQPTYRSYNRGEKLSSNGELNTSPTSGSSSSRSASSNTRELSDSSQSYNSEQPNKRRSDGYTMHRGYNRGYSGIARRPFYVLGICERNNEGIQSWIPLPLAICCSCSVCCSYSQINRKDILPICIFVCCLLHPMIMLLGTGEDLSIICY